MQVLVPAHAGAGPREDGKGTAADKGEGSQNPANLGDEDLKRLGALEAVKNAESDEDDERGRLATVADGIITGYAYIECDPDGDVLLDAERRVVGPAQAR